MSRRSSRLLLAVLLLLGTVACGDDDDAGSEESTTSADATGSDDTVVDEDAVPEPPDVSVPEVPAGEPPVDGGDEDEGIGDPLVLVADLTADAEVPGPGDAGATGRFEAESGTPGELCIDMAVTGLDAEVTDAHIHEGAVGEAGGVEVTIGPPTASEGDTDTWTDVCVTVEPGLFEDLQSSTDAFYVNVHTSSFPDGAVRGQLALGTLFDLELS